MKSKFFLGVVAGIFLVALVIAVAAFGFSYVRAQAPKQANQSGTAVPGFGPGMMQRQGYGYGQGMMQGQGYGYGRGMMGGGRGMMGLNGNYGAMHTYMLDALSQNLGLTSQELQTRLNNGETVYQIAQSQGKTADQIQTLLQDSQDSALKNAVAAGVLTQAQADWMDQHMEQMWQQNGFIMAGCPFFNQAIPTAQP